MSAHCTAVRKDGQPCAGKALDGEAFCFAHSHTLAAQRRAGSARGGRNKSREARARRLVPASLRPVLDQLMTGLDDVASGQLDPRRAAAMASLAGAITRVYELAELEQRLAALEGEKAHDRIG